MYPAHQPTKRSLLKTVWFRRVGWSAEGMSHLVAVKRFNLLEPEITKSTVTNTVYVTGNFNTSKSIHDSGGLVKEIQSNRVNSIYPVMPVTHGPTSWMRHVVCDFGSKKLDATWGDTRLFSVKFYY